MKIYIPIDKSSVRPNPNAGRNYANIPGCRDLIYDKDGKVCGYIIDAYWLYTLSPEPPYLYEYEDVEWVCGGCSNSICLCDLIDDYDDVSETLLKDCCPHCYDQQDVYYEDLGDTELQRLANANNQVLTAYENPTKSKEIG